jgi:acetyltransferase-like isoleucine patch superfamily enzyme
MIGRVARYFSRFSNGKRIASLRTQGIDVPPSGHIHPTAELDSGGGRITVGERCVIDRGVIIRAYGGHITIGADCSINPYSVIYGHGGLEIGRGVRIATHCIIIPSNHNFTDPDTYIFQQGETTLGIRIEDDVWLGAGVTILDGVHIGRGVVVGAGTVVSKSLDAFGIYAGVPAKKIASRK